MSKGFGRQRNPIADAAEVLLGVASREGKPVILPMFPPENDAGVKPGQLRPRGTGKLPSSCDGVVCAIQCSADDAQEFLDLVMDWQRKKLSERGEQVPGTGGDR